MLVPNLAIFGLLISSMNSAFLKRFQKQGKIFLLLFHYNIKTPWIKSQGVYVSAKFVVLFCQFV